MKNTKANNKPWQTHLLAKEQTGELLRCWSEEGGGGKVPLLATTHMNITHGKNMMLATRTCGSALPCLSNPLLDFLFPVCLSFPIGKLTTAAPEHRPVCSPGWMPPPRVWAVEKQRVLLVPVAPRGRGAASPPNE